MSSVIDVLIQNKEWLFSGLGVAILTSLVSLFVGRAKKFSKTNQGNNVSRSNLNINMGGDVNINIGDKSDAEIISAIKSNNKVKNNDSV